MQAPRTGAAARERGDEAGGGAGPDEEVSTEMRGRFRRTGGKLFVALGVILAVIAGLDFAVSEPTSAAAAPVKASYLGHGPGMVIGGNYTKPVSSGFGDFSGLYRISVEGHETLVYCLDAFPRAPIVGITTWTKAGSLASVIDPALVPNVLRLLEAHDPASLDPTMKAEQAA